MKYRRIASFKSTDALHDYLTELGIELPLDAQVESGPDTPLARSFALRNGFTVGNRFAALPMEGWDGTVEGHPTELTARRWRNFGRSGAKLIWGGEAVAIRRDGRGNPRQLLISAETVGDLAGLRTTLVETHAAEFGETSDLLVGLQLTHAGRFSRPNEDGRRESVIVYHHPILDRKFGIPSECPVLTDDEIVQLVADYVSAACLAREAGFDFVDIKHSHGYLGHEFLSAVDREGRYGGDFVNRTRFLREIVAGIRSEAPGLEVGVRISAFDFVPFRPGPDNLGEPEPIAESGYRYAFGGDGTGLGIDLTETRALLDLLVSLNIQLVCLSAGSPYYNPHIIRPALFPPSDGYLPPEDPLVGVARQIAVTAELKKYRPELVVVGSGYTYLQEWLPNVAQQVIRTGQADFVGLGRMLLSYPEFAADILAGRPVQPRRLCRTLSDCTTAPRNGLVSGCYPLDRFYRQRPEARALGLIKKERANF